MGPAWADGRLTLGLFTRKPPPDPEATEHLVACVSALMEPPDRGTIMLAEPDGRDPGWLDLETVITLVRPVRRRFVLRLPGPMADVTEAAVQSLGSRMHS